MRAQTRRCYLRIPAFFMLGSMISFVVGIASADEFNGVEAFATTGTTTASNPSVYTNGTTMSGGGPGSNSISFNEFGSEMSASLFGNKTGAAPTPILKAKSQATGASAELAYTGAMATYEYNGAAPATIFFDWELTATMVEPTDTAASVRAKAMFLTDADMFSSDPSDFFESGSTIEDNFSNFYSDPGVLDETGFISFTADPGEKFWLVMGLQTYSGRGGSLADASSTFSGTMSSSSGSVSAIPEPCAAGVCLGLGVLALVRRKR